MEVPEFPNIACRSVNGNNFEKVFGSFYKANFTSIL